MNWGLVMQDITNVRCDAIVNAANRTLLGGTGVDGAIHHAAGPELLRHIEAKVPVIGKCEADDAVPIRCDVGMAVVTPSFGLAPVCNAIIHTVGPVWTGGWNNEVRKLAKCYWSCLDAAREHGFMSVAFPCISAGCYRFPTNLAADVAVRSVASWFKRNTDCGIKVIFVAYTVADNEAYENIMPYYGKRGESEQ